MTDPLENGENRKKSLKYAAKCYFYFYFYNVQMHIAQFADGFKKTLRRLSTGSSSIKRLIGLTYNRLILDDNWLIVYAIN